MKKTYFLLLLIIILNFVFFYSTLSYYFISDDFVYTRFNSISEVITLNTGEYHYNPVFWGFLFLIKNFAGFNSTIFHLFTIVIHLVNIILVYILAYKLTRNNKLGLLSALLFSFYFANYEVVFWITGISTSLMVSYYILSFLSFLNYLQSKKIIYYLLFFILFVFAVLSHEYAISLPLISIFYFLLFLKSKNKLNDILKLSALPFSFIFILTIAKIIYTSSSLVVSTPSISRFLISIIKSYLYLFLPFPYLIDNSPKLLLPLLFTILFIGILFKSRKNRLTIFLFFWVLTNVIMFSLTSNPQARYLYFSFIPTVILIVSFIRKFTFIKIAYLYLIILSGINFIQKQKIYWEKSSQITKTTLEYIKKTADFSKPIYFINFPDSVNGPPWNAYVFRRGLPQALENIYQTKPTYFYYRTIPLDEKVREDEYINTTQLINLTAQGEVYIFNPVLTKLEK